MNEEELDKILDVGNQRPFSYADRIEAATIDVGDREYVLAQIREQIRRLRESTVFMRRLAESLQRNKEILTKLSDM